MKLSNALVLAGSCCLGFGACGIDNRNVSAGDAFTREVEFAVENTPQVTPLPEGVGTGPQVIDLTENPPPQLAEPGGDLNFAVACYQMLHTTALAMHDQPLADTALRHIKDFTPQIMDLSEVLPGAVISDLERERKVTADDSVAEEARKNTRAAWTGGASVH